MTEVVLSEECFVSLSYECVLFNYLIGYLSLNAVMFRFQTGIDLEPKDV